MGNGSNIITRQCDHDYEWAVSGRIKKVVVLAIFARRFIIFTSTAWLDSSSFNIGKSGIASHDVAHTVGVANKLSKTKSRRGVLVITVILS